MLQKTEMSQVSTNAQIRVTSFFTQRNREMFRGLKNGEVMPKRDAFHQFSTQDVPNDVLYLSPTTINTLSWPEIHLFENDVVVAIKSNYYEISGLRGSKRFIQRRSEVNSQLVHFWTQKPTNKFHFVSVQRYLQTKSQMFLHINLTKFNPQKSIIEPVDFYISTNQQPRNNSVHQFWDFCSFETIEQCKKGILIVRSYIAEQSNNHYKIILLDLVDRRKVNITHSPNQKIKAKVLTIFDLDCQGSIGCSKQRFLKTIKSEFGDIVLVVTTVQVYEIQVQQMGQGFKINLKPYKVSKAISNSRSHYFKQDVKSSEMKMMVDDNFDQQILDARFMSNGLRLMILTNKSEIIVIQSHNYLFSQCILQVFNNNKLLLDQFVFEKLYPVNGSVAVQFHSKTQQSIAKNFGDSENKTERLTKGVIILKVQNNSFSLGKVINFHLQAKDLNFILVRECQGSDELLIQYIQKHQPYVLNVMKCHILMMQLNSLNKFAQLEYNYSKIIDQPSINNPLNHFHPFSQIQKKYHMVDMPLTGRVFYLINQKELTCYKIFNDLDSQKINREISRLFTHTFFQKPIKITVSPCTQHIAIIFKEFVKFFYFTYAEIKNYFTLKIKNTIDIKFIGRGEKLLIIDNQGIVYLIDSYSFKQEKLFDFHGQPCEAEMIDQRNILVRSVRNYLSLYRKVVDEETNKGTFQKVYEIKMEEGDQYTANKKNVVVFKKNHSIQVYSHFPMVIQTDLPETERQCYMAMQAVHPNLINRCQCISFKEGEMVSHVLLSEQLGFLLAATNRGNVKQYLWPLQSPTNPNPPIVFSQQVSSHRILNIFLDAKLVNLYVVGDNGLVEQLQVSQYINGEQMPYVYVFSDKTREEEMQKRQFTDRAYFIDHFTPTEAYLTQASQQNIEELQFLIDKLKDDIEEMVKSVSGKSKQEQGILKANTKQVQKEFKVILKNQEDRYAVQLENMRILIEQQDKHFEMERNKEVEGYQKSLLALYKESDRLKNVLKSQDERLTEERNAFRRDYSQRLNALNRQKQEQVRSLQLQYREIEQKRRVSQLQNQIYEREQQAQMQIFKTKMHRQQQLQLQNTQQQKQRLLGENTKKQKQINNLKSRSIYFQNLILQTKVQIGELLRDQQQYQSKKKYLQEELRDKQDIIEKIQHQLVQYLKNTEDMKTIKNNHQFQLEEYQNQVHPISDNFNQIQSNVKHMNIEIMKEYSLKVEKTELAERNLQLIESLKEKKRDATVRKLSVENRFTRLAERLTFLATHPFDVDLKVELKQLLQSGDRGQQMMLVDEQRQRQRREGEKLIRYKNMIRKQIEQEQKREQHIVKNQHQFFKYHNENTTLVREFNELKKLQKYLREELNKLEERVNVVKTSLFTTPVRRVPSVNLRKQIQKKLTPFQKYQEEQQIVVERKHQDTSDTKLTRNSQSLSFLKGLMKELNHTESKYEKVEVMRERVRTFVNPELKSKTEQIRKMLFGRSRGTSEMLKLK